MEVEKSNRAPAAFRASCVAAMLAVLFAFVAFAALAACVMIPEARMAAGLCLAAYLICKVVQLVNCRDDPRCDDLPPDPP